MADAIIVVDLGFGDAGKGTIVDFLARASRAHTVVRFNGGPQAGHNVVTPDGRHHTFAQFGSGTFVHGVRTLLSRFMLVEPYALLNEAAHLAEVGVDDALDRLAIDERCVVITPAHQAANRLRELARGAAAHGTCGLGIGETMADALASREHLLRAGELRDGKLVREKLVAASRQKLAECEQAIDAMRSAPQAAACAATLRDPTWIDAALENYAAVAEHAAIVSAGQANAALSGQGTVIFEGAQGVLLDENFGFHPHTTWSTTTAANADALLDESRFAGLRRRIGVLRTYATRHGTGPLVTEETTLRAALPEAHNRDDGWQGAFRIGPLDLVATRYALAVCPAGELAVTHLDRLPALPRRVCVAYEDAGVRFESLDVLPSDDPAERARFTARMRDVRPVYSDVVTATWEEFVTRVEAETGVPVTLTSFGPTPDQKKPRP